MRAPPPARLHVCGLLFSPATARPRCPWRARRREILRGDARGVEHGHLVRRRAALSLSGDDLPQLRHDVVRRDGALLDGHLELAGRDALRAVVHVDAGRGHKVGRKLLLALHVRADRADVRAGAHPVELDHGVGRRGDGDYGVRRARGSLAVRHGDELELAHRARGLQDDLDLAAHELDARGRRLLLARVPHLHVADVGARRERRGHHERAHVARTHHEQARRVLARQPLHAERRGGTGAQPRDRAGVQERQRGARGVVAQERGAKDLRQAAAGVAREPRRELQAKQAAARQLAGADVHVRRARLELLVHHGPRRGLPLRLLAVGVLDCLESVGHGEDLRDFLGGKYPDLRHASSCLPRAPGSGLPVARAPCPRRC